MYNVKEVEKLTGVEKGHFSKFFKNLKEAINVLTSDNGVSTSIEGLEDIKAAQNSELIKGLIEKNYPEQTSNFGHIKVEPRKNSEQEVKQIKEQEIKQIKEQEQREI